MAKVLLLGGTGAIGIYLSRELVLLGHEVVVTSRQNRLSADDVQYVVGNGKDDLFLAQTIAEMAPDVIVDFMIYKSNEFANRLPLLLKTVKQYVFLSSYRVFDEQLPLTERSPRLLDTINDRQYLSTDEYALAKARCEDLLRQSGYRNWTIARPSITFSQERFQFGCLESDVVCYRALRGYPIVMPQEMLSKRTTMTWAGDVAKLLARLVLNDRALGDDFNVVTSENHTWAEIAAMYYHAIGLKVKTVPLQEYLAFCGKYQVQYDRLFDRVMDNSKVLSVTGLRQEAFSRTADALTREVTANRKHLWTLHPNIFQNACIDRLCGSLAIPSGSITDKLFYLQWRFRSVSILFRGLRFLCRKVGLG